MNSAQLAHFSKSARNLPKPLRAALPKAFAVLAVINQLARLFCAKFNFQVSVHDLKSLAKTLNKKVKDDQLDALPQDTLIYLNKQDVMRETLRAGTTWAKARDTKTRATTSEEYLKAELKQRRAMTDAAGRLITGFASGLRRDTDFASDASFTQNFLDNTLKNRDHFKTLQKNTERDMDKAIAKTINTVIDNNIRMPFRTIVKFGVKQKVTKRVNARNVSDFLNLMSNIPSTGQQPITDLNALTRHPVWTNNVIDLVADRQGWAGTKENVRTLIQDYPDLLSRPVQR